MNKYLKYIIFSIVISTSYSSNAQSIIKFINGTLTETTVENITTPVRGLNQEINDSSTLKLTDYIIVDINGAMRKILAGDYPDGIQIINLPNDQDKNPESGFWSNLYSVVFGDSFGDKTAIEDGLYMSNFQGVSRGLFDQPLKRWKVLPHYKSKIEWTSGNIFEIFKGKKLLLKKKEAGSFYVDEQVLNDCMPCTVMVDDNEGGFIDVALLNKEEGVFLESLFAKIDSNIDVEFSQFCIIQIFISNQLFMNANYFKDEFSDNKLIRDYLNKITLY